MRDNAGKARVVSIMEGFIWLEEFDFNPQRNGGPFEKIMFPIIISDLTTQVAMSRSHGFL